MQCIYAWKNMSDNVVKLLSAHIAASMVESCQRACKDSKDPNDFVNAMLNKETIEMIVNQIKNDECDCVQFKSGWLGAPSVNKLTIMAAPTDLLISLINEKFKPMFKDHMLPMCSSSCNRAYLTSVLISIIDKIGITEIIHDTFESKPEPSKRYGGRSRRRTHGRMRRRRMRRSQRRRRATTPDLNVCKINIKYMMHCIICFHNTNHAVFCNE
jgi:hypothetical protein